MLANEEKTGNRKQEGMQRIVSGVHTSFAGFGPNARGTRQVGGRAISVDDAQGRYQLGKRSLLYSLLAFLPSFAAMVYLPSDR
jgi:hypothetical protein